MVVVVLGWKSMWLTHEVIVNADYQSFQNHALHNHPTLGFRNPIGMHDDER